MKQYLITAAGISAALITMNATPMLAADEIVIDGRFDEWKDQSTLTVDPVDAPNGFVDLGAIGQQSDGRFIHLSIDTRRDVNLQAMPGHVTIYFDADNDTTTGVNNGLLPGTDVAIICTAPTNWRTESAGLGFAVEIYPASPIADGIWKESPYELGVSFAPTIASPRTEMRIARGMQLHGRSFFTGNAASMRIVATDPDGAIVDATRVMTLQMPAYQAEAAEPAQSITLDRAAGTDIRVMNWNVERGAMFENPDPFVRTLNALDADVILLEELTDKHSGKTLVEFFNTNCPQTNGETWHAHFGSGGGNLRSAIVSKTALETIPSMDRVAFDDNPSRTVRQASCILNVHGKRVLVCALHLKCCGFIDSREDKIRRNEVRLLSKAMSALSSNGSFDGIILGGDLNLVGSHWPLTDLTKMCELHGHAVDVADAYQLDMRTNATWFDPGQPFVPGRLDFILHSQEAFSMTRSFVFDAADLPLHVCEKTGLQTSDSLDASDHLPVVLDLQIRTR